MDLGIIRNIRSYLLYMMLIIMFLNGFLNVVRAHSLRIMADA